MEKMELPTVFAPPAYSSQKQNDSKKAGKVRALMTYAVTITVVLIVLIILGGVYYYKSLDTIQGTIKKYERVELSENQKSVKQEIEIDAGRNSVRVQLSGDGIPVGMYAVFDYTKSMIGLYDPASKQCLVVPGIDKDISDAKTLIQQLDMTANKSQANAESKNKMYYSIGNDYPIGDKTILPNQLQSDCQYLPTYWLEPFTLPSNATTAQGAHTKPGRVRRNACWFYYYYQEVEYWATCIDVLFLRVLCIHFARYSAEYERYCY